MKKQKKKHLQVIKAMNKAVSIKLLLDKDEVKGLQEGTPKYLTQAMTLHKNLEPKERILLEKEYQKLFGVSLNEQILDALDMDEIIQQINEGEGCGRKMWLCPGVLGRPEKNEGRRYLVKIRM